MLFTVPPNVDDPRNPRIDQLPTSASDHGGNVLRTSSLSLRYTICQLEITRGISLPFHSTSDI